MSRNQLDLFVEPEPDFFDESPEVKYRADPDDVRARLNLILSEARRAQSVPWDAMRLRLYRTIVPQMTLWLPEDEAAQLRFEFEQELVRLEAA